MKVLSRAMTKHVSGGCFICGNPNHGTHFGEFFIEAGPYIISGAICLRILSGMLDVEMEKGPSLGNVVRPLLRLGSIIGGKLGQAMDYGFKSAFSGPKSGSDVDSDYRLAFV
jgi:hypothetical protein